MNRTVVVKVVKNGQLALGFILESQQDLLMHWKWYTKESEKAPKLSSHFLKEYKKLKIDKCTALKCFVSSPLWLGSVVLKLGCVAESSRKLPESAKVSTLMQKST